MKFISAFDLDHTLVGSNSSVLFFRHLIDKGIFHPLSIFRTLFYKTEYHFFGLGLQELHRKVFRHFLRGKPLRYIQEHVESFVEADFYRHIYLPAFSHLRRAQHEGHHTVIISNSPSFLVEPIARYLGVNEWHGSNYLTDEKGVLSEIGLILTGEEKASCLQKMMNRFKTKKENVIAYSDSLVDLPFLFAAGKAVAVNPTGKMKRISEENDWEMI